jgi:hypothetical protein
MSVAHFQTKNQFAVVSAARGVAAAPPGNRPEN